MTVVLVGSTPPEVELYLARRRQLGLDGKDEVWDGVYHVVPQASMRHVRTQSQVEAVLDLPAQQHGLYVTGDFNLGSADSYRVPDFGVHRDRATGVFVQHAFVVGEVLSENDETWNKFEFYAGLRIPEIMVVDPLMKRVHCFALDLAASQYNSVELCEALGVTADKVARSIEWP